MLLNNDSHVRGIFMYSDDIEFEKDDFVVEGNCIYICTSSTPIKRKKPSKNPDYYTAYPGDKITTAQEYYNYLDTRENGEDKYVSAYALCDILENMYFGFGDNGLVVDHVLYNPAEGIDYSIRSVKEVLDNDTPNILNRILQTEDLNNGLVKISRSIKEISDTLQEDYNSETFESDVVILRQYTYFDSTKETKFRIQELIDPEKNKIYFRFSKGEVRDDITYFDSASPWKNIYSNDEEIRNRLNTIEDYYRTKTLEIQDLYNRLKGKYCYRNVEISEPSSAIALIPGGTKDIKSIESFETKSCFLDIIIKSPIDGTENLYKNYSITIDAKDIVEAENSTEQYKITDDITLTGLFYRNGSGYETLGLSVPTSCIIKDIYYRDYTLGHIHNWRLTETITAPTCTSEGWGTYTCDFCEETREDIIPRLGHDMTKHEGYPATCITDGLHDYCTCSNEPGIYYKNMNGTSQFSGWDTGDDPVVIPALGDNHDWTDWRTVRPATCTDDGYEERECRICHLVETNTLPATGHDLVENPRQEPTCGEFGIDRYWNCETCGKMFSDSAGTTEIRENDVILLPTGNHNIGSHVYDTSHIILEPTYTDDPNPKKGIGLIQCADCDNYVEVELDYKMHILDPVTSSRYEHHAATCTEDEWEQGVCTCHGVIRKNIMFGTALGHTVVHEPNDENYTASDCATGTDGHWKGDVCTVCGAHDVIEYNPDDKAKHMINTSLSQYRPSSCNRSAYWLGTCTVCGANHIAQEDSTHKAVGHPDRNEDNRCDVCGTILTVDERTQTE